MYAWSHAQPVRWQSSKAFIYQGTPNPSVCDIFAMITKIPGRYGSVTDYLFIEDTLAGIRDRINPNEMYTQDMVELQKTRKSLVVG